MAVELPFNSYTNLFASVILTAMALLALRAAPRSAANRFFAFFLLLVAANFAANFLSDYQTTPATNSVKPRLVAVAFLVLDPAIMLYFASLFPRRRALAHDPRWAAALIGVCVFLYSYMIVAIRSGHGEAIVNTTTHPFRIALFSYLAICYMAAMILIIDAWLREPSPSRRALLSLLVIAFGTALIPRVGALPADLGAGFGWATLALTVALYVVTFGTTLFLANGKRRAVIGVGLITAFFILLVTLSWLYQILAASQATGEGAGAFTYRWFLFALLVAYAILRHHVFDIDLRFRRGVSVGFGAAVVLLAFFGGKAAAEAIWPTLATPFPEAVGLFTATLMVLPAMSAGPFISRAVLPWAEPTERFLRQRKLEVYHAAVTRALDEGRELDQDSSLQHLREQLGLSPADHRSISSLAQAEKRFGSRGAQGIAGRALVAGRYRVRRRIGRGHFGTVHLALDETTGKEVVLKELRPHWLGDPTAVARIEREATVLEQIDHPNVVRLLDQFKFGEIPVLVLEYMGGGSLKDRLSGNPLPVGHAVRIATETLQGLGALHQRGIIHRDVKPANILFTASGEAKIGDLGIARVTSEEDLTLATLGNAQPGTLAYMSPEQARGESLDARSDLYSAGAVLYEMLTGKPPVDVRGLPEYKARERLQNAAAALPIPGLPSRLNEVLAKALDVDRENRPSSVREILDVLESLASEGGMVSPRQAPIRVTDRRELSVAVD